MILLRLVTLLAFTFSAAFLTGCGRQASTPSASSSTTATTNDNVVNIYFWSGYLTPEALSSFEKQTGIKVNFTRMDNLESLETKLLTGHSGFDVVVPTNMFFDREIHAGAYQALDKSQLPNLRHLYPDVVSRLAQIDPGNTYGVAFTRGRIGLGYDDAKIAKALPGVPLNSWNLLLDPAHAAKLAACGIHIIDDPVGVVHSVLLYLGKDPNNASPADLEAAEAMLRKIRPYVRNIDTASYTDAFANGDICIAIAYNNDVSVANKRAHEIRNGVSLSFLTPAEGGVLYVDLLAIPKDAPHLANAHKFINYLLDPQLAARVSTAMGFATANSDAKAFLDPTTAADPIIFPDAAAMQRLTLTKGPSAETNRAITRFWQAFRSGQ